MALRATCRPCLRLVTIDPETVLLTISDDGRARYVFECPFCATLMWRELSDTSLNAMVTEGVSVTSADPASKSDARPPITPDDLLDFHELLQTEAWFTQLGSMGAATARHRRRL